MSDLKEIAKDEQGNIIWERPYIFKRLSAVGEFLMEGGISYTVVSSEQVGNEIHTVLRRKP